MQQRILQMLVQLKRNRLPTPERWALMSGFLMIISEMDPVFSRNGEKPEKYYGESSEIIIDEAIDLLKENRRTRLLCFWLFGLVLLTSLIAAQKLTWLSIKIYLRSTRKLKSRSPQMKQV